jgi:hypothetical protein
MQSHPRVDGPWAFEETRLNEWSLDLVCDDLLLVGLRSFCAAESTVVLVIHIGSGRFKAPSKVFDVQVSLVEQADVTLYGSCGPEGGRRHCEVGTDAKQREVCESEEHEALDGSLSTPNPEGTQAKNHDTLKDRQDVERVCISRSECVPAQSQTKARESEQPQDDCPDDPTFAASYAASLKQPVEAPGPEHSEHDDSERRIHEVHGVGEKRQGGEELPGAWDPGSRKHQEPGKQGGPPPLGLGAEQRGDSHDHADTEKRPHPKVPVEEHDFWSEPASDIPETQGEVG